MILSILTLTTAYAVLSVTLNIQGNASVVASTWDIHLANVKVTTDSVSAPTPTIVSPTTAAFSAELKLPGDYYDFTIDIVNDGSIDAMIDSIVKTPELTAEQKKYLKYEIKYENGESIENQQLVQKNSFVRLMIRVEYRKDISVSDLPSVTETLNLSFTINYIQSNGAGTNVKDQGVAKIRVVSGDYDTPGSQICIGKECFYVLHSTSSTVTMLTKYNLLVGSVTTGEDPETGGPIIVPLENPTGIQDPTAVGGRTDENDNSIYPFIGVLPFSTTAYWLADGILKPEYGTETPADVYDSNSLLYPYVENYRNYIISQGITPTEARLISVNDINRLGEILGENSEFPKWLISTVYWMGMAAKGLISDADVYISLNDDVFPIFLVPYDTDGAMGVRPVITVSKSYFN